MKLKKLFAFGSSLVLSLSSLLVFAPLAHAATITWDGGGSDDNFNTAENWVGDVAPTNGDSLVFDNTSFSANETFTNDLSNASFTSLTFQGNTNNSFTIEGNSFAVTGGITNSANSLATIEANLEVGGNQNFAGTLDITGNLSGSGNITKNDTATLFLSGNNSSFSGDITITQGSVWIEHVNGLGSAVGETTVADGAQLLIVTESMGANPTIAEPMTLSGDGTGAGFTNFALGVLKCVGINCTAEGKTLTLSGAITLGAATKVYPAHELKLTGALSGAFTIGVAQGQEGKLILENAPNNSQSANGTYEAPLVTTTLSDDQSATPVSINYNETTIITGKRQSVSVNNGGVLKGTGTVGTTVVQEGGTIAPGLSPGCINTGNFTLIGAFQVELGGATVCSDYDQTKVTGTVNVTGGELEMVLFNGFQPAVNQAFVIIDNDGADAVTGTLTNLAEGATFDADGYVYRVSYIGGDGNDVTLTVVSVPANPNTGLSLVSANPLATFGITSGLAGLIALIARRYKKALARY